ncbi:hypothetical protein GCM10025883_24870 [Mobilicoccus caccae]|uniref:Gametolysin peptidase M11 n=1 Tax=Mobilicoccus caccae TaxID=1859295 RepID=A0ABQ6ITG2_9MICO|nr:hypothetical protein GCM10025883_24870 [Mobilicoccus caccae]
MRVNRPMAIAALTITLVTASTPGLVAHANPADGDAQVRVVGVVERLADPVDGLESAVRLPGGERLPVDAAGRARPGDEVSVTIPVTQDVVEAAESGRSVPGVDGEVSPTRRELRRASATPAAPDSALAKATVQDVVDAGRVAPVDTVTVLQQARSGAGSVGAVHDVTVAIVAPKGVRGRVATRAQVATQVKNVGAYWREQSGGAVDFRLARTVGAYASAYTCKDSPFKLWTEAARATGFDEGPGKHLVVVLPREAVDAGCSYGLASMGQDVESGGVAYVADTSWPVLAHELGHNFGLAHAKALQCRSITDADLARVPSSCGVDEYGDPFDVMAASAANVAGSLSVPQAVRVGFIGSSGYVDVRSGVRKVTLNAVSSLNGVRGVRVRDPRSGAVYWVEYRTRAGRDSALYRPMTAGVRVLREESVTPDTPWPGTVALDASPTGRDSDASWQVPAKHLFTSYGSGVSVTVESVAGARATVSVSVSAAGRRVAGARAGAVSRVGTAAAAAPSTPSLAINSRGVVSWKTQRAVRYDVVVRRVDGRSHGRIQTWYAGTTRTSAQLKAARGTTVQVRARAKGADGRVGAWSSWRAVAFR